MPNVKHHEIVIVKGQGAYVWDDRGRRLLDVPASLWCCNVGHGRAEIAEAVASQMRTLEAYSTFQGYATAPAVSLASRLAELSPVVDAKVFLTSGGGESIDTAAKLVRRYWSACGKPERRTIVSRNHAYHGLHGFGTSITGLALNREGLGELLPDTVRIAHDDPRELEKLARENEGQIAAFFCEPIIGTGGVLFPESGYLQEIQRICRAHEIVLVIDEIITGFGRTGAMFACDRFGITPDILVVAKGVTSGYMPLGAVIIAEPVWRPFWADDSDLVFRHGITYSGHAAACAAAHANLDILETEGLVGHVRDLEAEFALAVNGIGQNPLVKRVTTGVGLLAGVQMVDPKDAERVAEICLDLGCVMRVISNGTLQISPPFVIDQPEIATIVATIAAAIEVVGARG